MRRDGLTTISPIVAAAILLLSTAAHAFDARALLKSLSAAKSGPQMTAPAIATPPLSKFQVVGRVTATLTGPACPAGPFGPGGPFTCTACAQLQISGPVLLTPGGKGTLSACLTIDYTNNNGQICIGDEQGQGIITLTNKDTIIFATSGHFCIADVIFPNNPMITVFNSTGAYTIEGGSGKEINAVGQGEFSLPWLETSSGPTSTGVLNMIGSYAKH